MEYIEILKALLTPLIAIIAVYIAYQQYSLAKHKTDVEIYDRRINIYRKTIKLLRDVDNNGFLSEEDYNNWELIIFEAELLFDKVVIKHLMKINELAADIVLLEMEINKTKSTKKKSQMQVEYSKVFVQLTSLTKTTMTVFHPYFDIIKDRHRINRKNDYDDILNDEKIEIEKMLNTVK